MIFTAVYLNHHYATLHAGHGSVPGLSPVLGYLAGFDERNPAGELTGRRLWRVRLKDGTGTDRKGKDFENAEAALASVERK